MHVGVTPCARGCDTVCACPQAQIQEQQQVQEVGRLKKAIATLLQEAGERTRREVSASCVEFPVTDGVMSPFLSVLGT